MVLINILMESQIREICWKMLTGRYYDLTNESILQIRVPYVIRVCTKYAPLLIMLLVASIVIIPAMVVAAGHSRHLGHGCVCKRNPMIVHLVPDPMILINLPKTLLLDKRSRDSLLTSFFCEKLISIDSSS